MFEFCLGLWVTENPSWHFNHLEDNDKWQRQLQLQRRLQMEYKLDDLWLSLIFQAENKNNTNKNIDSFKHFPNHCQKV